MNMSWRMDPSMFPPAMLPTKPKKFQTVPMMPMTMQPMRRSRQKQQPSTRQHILTLKVDFRVGFQREKTVLLSET